MNVTEVLLLLGITVGMVPLSMWLVSAVSPWRRLARRFPVREVQLVGSDGAPIRRGRSGWLWLDPLGGYNGCVVWAADDEYLHLRLWRGLGFGHPPMSVPWSEIEFPILTRSGGVRAGWGNEVEVVISGDVTGRLPRRMVEGELEVRQSRYRAPEARA